MTRDEAVDLLMGRLGKRVSTTTQQDIINEMDFVQTSLLETDPTCMYWFLVTTEQTLATVANTTEVAVPSDWLQEWEEDLPEILDSDGERQTLVRDDWDVLAANSDLDGTGRPEYYDIGGENFLFRKQPDAVYTVYHRYYQAQTSIAGAYGDAANIENGWLKHAADLMIAETGAIISEQYLQSTTMHQRFMAQAQKARLRLMQKDTMMRETNKQRAMGDD